MPRTRRKAPASGGGVEGRTSKEREKGAEGDREKQEGDELEAFFYHVYESLTPTLVQ